MEIGMSRPVYLRETRHDAVKAAITFAACGTSDLDAREWAVRRWGEAYAPLEINKAVAAGDLGSARYPCVAMTLTTFLAAWGAVLSSIMALREVLASRDKLKVQLIHGVSDELGACAVLFIANPGKRGVMVEYAGFAWPFETLSFVKKLRQFLKYRNHWGTIGWCHTPLAADIVESSPLPKLLEPGHSVQIWISLIVLMQGARDTPGSIIAQVQDALGRN